MNPEKFRVELTVAGETDVLIFHFDSDAKPEGIPVNLNSSESQQDLKIVFTELLVMLQTKDIELELEISNGYSKGLYKDVCSEYIKDLNTELKQVRQRIQSELK